MNNAVPIIVAAEITSICYVLISLFNQYIGCINQKSAKSLRICTLITICWQVCDVLAYTVNGPSLPKFLLYMINYLAYIMGTVVLFLFVQYCYMFMKERTTIKAWTCIVPSAIVIAASIITSVYFMLGKLVIYKDGYMTVVGQVPTIASLFQIAVLIFIPVVAVIKRREIGARAVALLGVYGMIPLVAIVIMRITGLETTVPASAISMVIVVSLLQKIETGNHLQEKNVELEGLLEKQTVQIEQINDLNRELEERRSVLETRFNIINSMTQVYFAAFYIDIKDDSFITLATKDNIEKVIHKTGKAQKSLFLACDTLMAPEYSEEMREFLDLSTLPERMKDTNTLTHKYMGATTGWSRAYLILGDRDENGNPLHIFYAARMIHEEHERELAHIAEMEEVSDITSNAGLGMWKIILKDGAAPRMKANKKMAQLLGISASNMTEEEVYSSWYDNILPNAIESVQASVQEMLSGKFSENTYEWKHPTKGVVYVRCGGTSLTMEDGTKVLRGYHADVTELVLAEEKQKKEIEKARKKAERANAAKTTFLFNMSHDIRTPMNAIVGYVELLENCQEEPERFRDYMEKIKASCNFLLTLINNVLEMAKIESGKATVDLTVYHVGDIISEVSSVYSELMKKKNLVFSNTIDTHTEYLYGDVVKSREILLNLISNAYKYTPEGGRVDVRTVELESDKPGYVVLQTTVTDTGIGMSKEFLPKLFEEFSRAGNMTETKIEGSGLGMPIVKKLVELMDGTITVESELGKGTTFVVTVPHRIAEKPVEILETEEIIERNYTGKRILLAEDNELNAEIAKEILNGIGFMVEHAWDGIECVDMIQKADRNHYNLIFMDVQMPNMDGYKATKIIRALPEKDKNSIPIVALTANAFEEDVQNALKAGMDAHLAKPIVMANLRKVLANLIE